MATRTIGAGEFKAKCLALLDEVAATGDEIIVTKRGKPVARVVRNGTGPEAKRPTPLAGSILWEKDIVSPLDDEWEADR